MGGRLLDWLGAGASTALPAPATMATLIPVNSAALFFGTDNKHLYVFDQSGPSWFDIDVGTLSTMTTESIQDMIAAFLVQGTGINLVYDDAANSLTVNCVVTQYTDEMAQDTIAAMIAAGTQVGLTVTYDDVANTLSFTNTVTQYTDEMAQDAVAAMLAAGTDTGLTVTYNDAGNAESIVVSASYIDGRIAAASIDALADVDTTTTAPTNGQALVWDNTAGKWKPGSVAGGGTRAHPWYFQPPTAAQFPTTYASLRAGSAAVGVTDDSDAGLVLFKNADAAGSFTMKAVGRAIPLGNRGSGTTFTITAHLKSNMVQNNMQFGIWARTDASHYLFWDVFGRGTSANLQRCYYNGAWNDGVFSASAYNPLDVWLRLRILNQTTHYDFSVDGKSWLPDVYASENLFAASFTDYGFCLGGATSDIFHLTCDALWSDEFPRV